MYIKVFHNVEILITEEKTGWGKSMLNSHIWNCADWKFLTRLFANIYFQTSFSEFIHLCY